MAEETEKNKSEALSAPKREDQIMNLYYKLQEKAPFTRRFNPVGFFIVLLVVLVFVIFIAAGKVDLGEFVHGAIREPLDSALVKETEEYYSGESEWTKGSGLETSLKSFYERTGVQPYVLDVTGTGMDYTYKELESLASEFYSETFEDEGHFLLVFQGEDDGYQAVCYAGEDAKSVMDEEAVDIFLNNLSSCASMYVLKDDVISEAFSGTATDLMGRNIPVWVYIVIILVLALLAVMFGWLSYMGFKEQRRMFGRNLKERTDAEL